MTPPAESFDTRLDEIAHLLYNQFEKPEWGKQAIRELVLSEGDKLFIALVCPDPECYRAQVSSRELSRVAGTITDPPSATSVYIRCSEHTSDDFEDPEYFDEKGEEVSSIEHLEQAERARINGGKA